MKGLIPLFVLGIVLSAKAQGKTCPKVSEDPPTDILLPHESDCTKFYKCSHGEAVLLNCPSGLHFNTEKDECDWPHNVNCGNNGGDEDDSDIQVSNEDDNDCPIVVEDPERDVLLPHESDCSKFYKCSHGEKTLQDCPDGLYYNPERRYCDWPLNTNCTNNGTADAQHQRQNLPSNDDEISKNIIDHVEN